MVITAIQVQSTIVCLVLLVVVCIIGTYACKIEREEEELRRKDNGKYRKLK